MRENITITLSLPPSLTLNPQESFLALLKRELESQKLKTPTKNETCPRMFISVSAYEYYGNFCSRRVQDRSEQGLETWINNDVTYPSYAIDTKKLAGKVMLCTPEVKVKGELLNHDDYLRHQKEQYGTLSHEPKYKVPFYTGFRSSRGDQSFLPGYSKLLYCLPRSFDGVPFIPATKKRKERSPMMENTSMKEEQLSSSQQVIKSQPGFSERIDKTKGKGKERF